LLYQRVIFVTAIGGWKSGLKESPKFAAESRIFVSFVDFQKVNGDSAAAAPWAAF
jgi:hypothetical protein